MNLSAVTVCLALSNVLALVGLWCCQLVTSCVPRVALCTFPQAKNGEKWLEANPRYYIACVSDSALPPALASNCSSNLLSLWFLCFHSFIRSSLLLLSVLFALLKHFFFYQPLAMLFSNSNSLKRGPLGSVSSCYSFAQVEGCPTLETGCAGIRHGVWCTDKVIYPELRLLKWAWLSK